MSLFLTSAEIEELTGIKKGRDGLRREVLQCQHLRENGIPFTPNVRGEPKVCRAIIEGKTAPQQKQQGWSPAVLNFPKRA